MNESLRRALLQAGLSEDDVASRLEVDPKTVRRWVEGRVPYLRHRWALAGMLGVDESDLWPQLQPAGSVPPEVQAIYPHFDAVPCQVWLRLFRSAERRIDILAESGDSVIANADVLEVLARKGRAGLAIRICLVDPAVTDRVGGEDADRGMARPSGTPPILGEALSGSSGCVQVRRREGRLYSSVYRADGELVVSQRAYGISAMQAPVLHLHGGADGHLAAAYLDGFERFWADQIDE